MASLPQRIYFFGVIDLFAFALVTVWWAILPAPTAVASHILQKWFWLRTSEICSIACFALNIPLFHGTVCFGKLFGILLNKLLSTTLAEDYIDGD